MDETLLIFAALVGLTLGVVAGGAASTALWQKDVIERGLGLYCPLDGEFAFTGECGK
jgi:hypothetical protein